MSLQRRASGFAATQTGVGHQQDAWKHGLRFEQGCRLQLQDGFRADGGHGDSLDSWEYEVGGGIGRDHFQFNCPIQGAVQNALDELNGSSRQFGFRLVAD